MKARDKPSPRAYAYLAPKARVLAARVRAGEDRVREAIAQPSLEEAQGFLKDTLYGEAIEPGPAWRIQARVAEALAAVLDRLARAAPEPARPLARAHLREMEARDALQALRALQAGDLQLELLPTSRVPGTILYQARQEQEPLTSPQRLRDYLRRTWLNPILEAAGEDPRLAETAAALHAHAEALEALNPRRGRPEAARATCPLQAWRTAALTLDARAAGLPARSLEALTPENPTCNITPRQIRAIYEREQTTEALAVALRDTLRLPLDPSKPPLQALEEARAHARRQAKQAAYTILQGYPFHAGILAAAATLARLEAEDITTVATGLALRLPPDKYIPKTTYNITL